jgi:hypothetical protein
VNEMCPYCRTGVCYAHDAARRYPGLGESLQRERTEAATAQRHAEICQRLDKLNDMLVELVKHFTGRRM